VEPIPKGARSVGDLEERAMVAVEREVVGVRRTTHPEEWLSILFALAASVGASFYFWVAPSYSPEAGLIWALPGWLAFAYLFFQMLFLLVSASQIRALGVLDSIVAIFPVVAGLVIVVEWMLGHLALSTFQVNALAILLAAAVGEFLLTIWIRFVVNRRTLAIDAG
jgi:hypothetical protein